MPIFSYPEEAPKEFEKGKDRLFNRPQKRGRCAQGPNASSSQGGDLRKRRVLMEPTILVDVQWKIEESFLEELKLTEKRVNQKKSSTKNDS